MFSSTGQLLQPVFEAAQASNAKRIAYADGEDIRVLRAAQVAVEEGIAKPILIGRPAVIEARIAKAGLRIRPGVDFVLVNPDDDSRFRQYWQAFHQIMGRRGFSPEAAKAAVRRSSTTIAALMVHLGDADAMVCGLHGRFDAHLAHIQEVIGLRAGAHELATLNALMLDKQTLFIADTYVNGDPSAEQLARIAKMAVEEVRRFGIVPKVAFLSHSNYGSSNRPSALKMRSAWQLFTSLCPDVESDGEMHGDAALSELIRKGNLMDSNLKGEANVLICPNVDAANILYNVLKIVAGEGKTVGPMLMGAARPAHVLTPSSTVRRVTYMTALAVAQGRHA
jgi:malate dehydrogenase (oxaloacetate-decarboxylating)(NADP+)